MTDEKLDEALRENKMLKDEVLRSAMEWKNNPMWENN
jgi:hypothetical protein